jgi:hypothetical protein
MSECYKCRKEIDQGTTIVEDGISYFFCNSCYEVIEPINIENRIKNFVNQSSRVEKDMQEARKRRAAGIRLWS